MTKIYLVMGKRKIETKISILPYKGCKVMYEGKEYKVIDVVVYADLNTVYITI